MLIFPIKKYIILMKKEFFFYLLNIIVRTEKSTSSKHKWVLKSPTQRGCSYVGHVNNLWAESMKSGIMMVMDGMEGLSQSRGSHPRAWSESTKHSSTVLTFFEVLIGFFFVNAPFLVIITNQPPQLNNQIPV